jgi:hypothetical protein
MKIAKYILIIVLAGIGVYFVLQREPEVAPIPTIGETDKKPSIKPDTKNLQYEVDGDVFDVKDGRAEISIADSATKSTLDVFGETYGDLDGDGDLDAVVWLVNDPGGTGRFFYGAFVINDKGVYKTTNATFLGDRISTKDITIKDGRVIYNFLERAPSDPMSADPTVNVNLWVYYDRITGEMLEYEKRY